MVKVMSVSLLALSGALVSVATAHAATAHAAAPPVNTSPVSWTQHDTAAYVVSTLNLVRTGDGRPLVPLVTADYGVRRFAVWQDLQTSGYVIQLKRITGMNAGALVYQLGWEKPGSFSRLTRQLGVAKPVLPIEGHFREHAKLLIGSFASTLPS